MLIAHDIIQKALHPAQQVSPSREAHTWLCETRIPWARTNRVDDAHWCLGLKKVLFWAMCVLELVISDREGVGEGDWSKGWSKDGVRE